MKNALNYLNRPARCAAALIASSFSLVLSAQDWLVVDTFDGGAPQATWEVAPDIVLDFSNNNLRARNVSTINTRRMYVALPQAVTSGKATIYLDLYLPAGPVQNQFGFGGGTLAQVEKSAWTSPGANNRFQTANAHPQNLVKAGDWSNDLLAPTLQAVWYNIWIVYDLDAKKLSFYQRRADSESMEAQLAGQWDFDLRTDDLSSISHFAFGLGTLDQAVQGFSSLGGVVDNLYMAVGEKLTLPPTGIVLGPPEWQVVETFAGAQPNATWAGDLDKLGLDFSGGYLLMSGNTTTNRSNIYTELPETITGGRFTVTFDMFVAGTTADRTDLGFAAVGDTQIALSGVDQRGGFDFIGTFGATPQNLTKRGDFGNVLIPGADLPGNWYHIWLYYDLAANTLSYYHAPFGGDAPSADAPVATWVLSNTYSNFRYFIAGLDRPANPGLGIGNIYFASDQLITLSPTAGTFDPNGGGDSGEWFPDDVLGWTWNYGSDWHYWLAHGNLAEEYMGVIHVGLRNHDGSGWVYHHELGEYLYIAATDGAFFIWRQSTGWVPEAWSPSL